MSTVAYALREIESSLFSMEARALTPILAILDDSLANVKINDALGKRLYHFQIGYVNTSREYVEFFGSNLLGVHVIRFRDADVLRFFNEVLEIDYDQVETRVRAVDTVINTYKIGGDILNLTLMYLISKILRDKTISDRGRAHAAHNAALIFFYRAMAATLSAWFKYPADPKISQAAYRNLSYKFLIKKYGSWHKVMDYRAENLISKAGVSYQKLMKLGNDEDLVKVINEGANAIRDMLLNYYVEFKKVLDQGEGIGVTQATGLDVEGKEVVRDRINNVEKSVALAKQYLTDPNAFIRDEFVRVIVDINKNTSFRLVKDSLVWLTQNSAGKDFKLIDQWISQVVIFSFYLIETRIESTRWKDIPYLLIQLKNFYLSSRSTEEDLLHIREQTDKLLLKAHKKLSTPLLLSTRTALILYVTLAVLAGKSHS